MAKERVPQHHYPDSPMDGSDDRTNANAEITKNATVFCCSQCYELPSECSQTWRFFLDAIATGQIDHNPANAVDHLAAIIRDTEIMVRVEPFHSRKVTYYAADKTGFVEIERTTEKLTLPDWLEGMFVREPADNLILLCENHERTFRCHLFFRKSAANRKCL